MKVPLKKRLWVILVRPEKPENIGMAARAMKNTGFENLRIVGLDRLDPKSFVTAVHAGDILEKTEFFPDLKKTTEDLDVILATTSKKRKNFPRLNLEEAVDSLFRLPSSTRIGLLFGNEITGLTSYELRCANFLLAIPQAGGQPSYNLASAVLVTLFSIFTHNRRESGFAFEKPLLRKEQDECIRRILQKLEEKKFIHGTNKKHVTEMIFSLFGRMLLTERDRNLLLALFDKGPDSQI